MEIQVRIAGEAGQGVQTTGNLLVSSFARLGVQVAATQSYMSRIRGGLNWVDIRVGAEADYATRDSPDLLIALTDAAVEILGGELAGGGTVVYNGQARDGALAIDLAGLAKSAGGKPIMANAVAAGAVYALLGYDVEALCGFLQEAFRKKGPEVAEANAACARAGGQALRDHAGMLAAPPPGDSARTLYHGAEAIALGAATAGVKVASAYPMTPGTGVLQELARLGERYGIVVEQAEDEIAAANLACGAVYAGAPALVTTSGGGFALMVEAVSLAGMMELPLFIVLAQRPGPATGLPTRTAQQDLRFALHAGHGEFPRAVFAPGSACQAYGLTRRALETAHKYQTPVVLLTDQFLQDLRQFIEPLDDAYRPIDRHLADGRDAAYVRYAVTDGGVSPRAVPGGAAPVVCDSDEHTDAGHLTEDLGVHLRQQDKRMAKGAALASEALPPERYGPPDAETVLICWGSTRSACREAVDRLGAAGASAAMVHFAQVWPVNADAAREAIGRPGRLLCVEGNCTGQFESVLREVGAIDGAEKLLRYDGLPFTAESIVSEVTR